ncbi:RsmF rRNA methyltransferase first C-terminal domain-containing protein [Paenibacillus sp. TRM 82003]|nr:RsmF rRNA methyltransferase first C-terminal domain-containing protein [Paenibacillus sp. TRM 82003]
MQLPEAFVGKMRWLLDAEADLLIASYEKPKASGLRLNPLKIDAGAFAARWPHPLEPVPWCRTGFYYEEDAAPGRHPYHAAGLYYIQEPSAMYPAEALDAVPGERVLDLCAAPGGKTTHIGGALKGRGLLIANEYEAKRAKALSENVERLGLTNCLVTNETPERLAARFPGFFDRILVDAPCSGEGMFRKDPEAASYWSERHVAACARTQADVLDAAYAMLREGGVLVYSTCTFSPEENELAIEALLARYPDLELLPMPQIGGVSPGVPGWSASGDERLTATTRLWPHRLRGEGHFAAKLRKRAATAPWSGKTAAGNAAKQPLALYRDFERRALREPMDGTFLLHGTQLYLVPEEAPDVSGLRVVRPGLHLGEAKKDRFEPNHALALALPPERFAATFELLEAGERAADAYLRGETLPGTGDRGWLAMTYGGFPLGWGKEAKGTIKNFYPKGLRRVGI